LSVPVSRETDAPPPELIARLFPDDKAIRRYVDLLTSAGVERGLVGPREAGRIWTRHVLNCAVVESAIPARATVVDVGSGAGLPGLVLAIARPDLTVTLVEPLLRRATFLAEVVADLALPRVVIVRARAEDLPVDVRYDIATARAVAPLRRLVPWTLPLCRVGGELIALKGSSAREEIADAQPVIAKCGGADVRVETVGDGLVDPAPTIVRIRSTGHGSPHREGRH
jgi:16S rRNA (guanine527-N7)-methyltransferase